MEVFSEIIFSVSVWQGEPGLPGGPGFPGSLCLSGAAANPDTPGAKS